MTFADFIDQKGRRPLALALEVNEATIRSWVCRKNIPRAYWHTLIGLYPRLTLSQLVNLEIAGRMARDGEKIKQSA